MTLAMCRDGALRRRSKNTRLSLRRKSSALDSHCFVVRPSQTLTGYGLPQDSNILLRLRHVAGKRVVAKNAATASPTDVGLGQTLSEDSETTDICSRPSFTEMLSASKGRRDAEGSTAVHPFADGPRPRIDHYKYLQISFLVFTGASSG